MAYIKTTTYTSGVNILASEVGLVLKTFEGTQAMATMTGSEIHRLIDLRRQLIK